MLRQEINLYKAFDAPQPAAYFLTWQRLCYCLLAIAVMFSVIYVFSLLHLYHLRHKNEALAVKVNHLKNEFETIKKLYPPLFFAQDVSLSINSLQQELTEQKRILSSLAKPTPFSKDLIAFSALMVPNVWLTGMTLTHRGADIVLKGKSTSMESLQKYINNLMVYPLFANYVFNIDNIIKTDKPSENGELNFELNMTKPAA